MKITKVKAHAISVPLTATFLIAGEAIAQAHQIIVEIETDDGLTGNGIINGRAIKQVMDVLARIEELLIGMDVLAHEDVWATVFGITTKKNVTKDDRQISFRSANRQAVLAALAGIDIAMWDLKGKVLATPIWKLLGGTRREIHAYASGGYYDDVSGKSLAVVEEMAAYVELGYRAVKMKCGGSTLAHDVERVKRVREAVGDADLMLDASRSFTFPEAVKAIKAFEPYDIFWFEEPLHWYDAIRGMGQLSRHTHVPMTSGESEQHFWACRDIVDLGAASYLNFDATRAGGVTEWLRIAAYAHAHGVLMAPHHNPEIQGHLVAAVPNGYCVEAFPDGRRDPFWNILYTHRADIKNGTLYLNDEPGFGFGIDWDVVEKYRV